MQQERYLKSTDLNGHIDHVNEWLKFSSIEWHAILLSIKAASISTICSIPFGIGISWLLSKSRLPGKVWIENLFTIPLVLPPIVTGYFLLVLLGQNGIIGASLYKWFGLQIAFTWKGAAVASGVVAFPLMIQTIKVSMDSVDPKLERAAQLLRANPLQVFFSVTLPLSYRGIIAGSVLAFARAFGEFGATIMLAGNISEKTQTIPLAIFSLFNQVDGEHSALRLIIISIIICYFSLIAACWFGKQWRVGKSR